ncbi:MAG TPA: hypothetical protein VEP89_04950 [Draconibacterium sp.]|nr:hypothetical protein [Draconibacterium sp.]
MKTPYLSWSYAYKENLFDLFMKLINSKQPYQEEDVFETWKKMSGQSVRSKTYQSLLMLLNEKNIRISYNDSKTKETFGTTA